MAKKLKSSKFLSTADGGFRDFDGFQSPLLCPQSELNNEVYTPADHQCGKVINRRCGKRMNAPGKKCESEGPGFK